MLVDELACLAVPEAEEVEDVFELVAVEKPEDADADADAAAPVAEAVFAAGVAPVVAAAPATAPVVTTTAW